MLEQTYEYLKEKVEFRFECPVAHIESDGPGDQHVARKWREIERTSSSSRRAALERSGSPMSATVSASSRRTIASTSACASRCRMRYGTISRARSTRQSCSTVRSSTATLCTFCADPHGHVFMENTDGIVTVNGHSYSDPKLQSHV